MNKRIIAVSGCVVIALAGSMAWVPIRRGIQFPARSPEAIEYRVWELEEAMEGPDSAERERRRAAAERELRLASGELVPLDPVWPPRYGWVFGKPARGGLSGMDALGFTMNGRTWINWRVLIPQQIVLLLLGGGLLAALVRRRRRQNSLSA